MRTILLLLFMTAALSGRAQVAEYLVICQNDQLEVVSSTEAAKYPNAVILKDKLPSKSAARSWMDANYAGKGCGAKAGPAVVPSTPPPAVPGTSPELPPPPPEKKISHIYPHKVAIFGTVLFPVGNWGDWQQVANDYDRFVPFLAGMNFRKGNKAKYGFELSFQGLSKTMQTDPDEKELLATATVSFLFSYPVAVDKQGRFWVVPEIGLGVDFFDVLQLIDKDDKLIAAPSMLLRVGVQMYHVMPFFYYGQTFMDVSKNFDLKPSHVGVGLAVTF